MNQQKIFNILPEQFFSVLSCSYQTVYSDCLFLMFIYLGKGFSFGGKKESIIELLTDYFYDKEDDKPREKAVGVLRRFKQCGWVFEEDDQNYEVFINFTDYAIPILKTLYDLKQHDELEYLSYIYLIYLALKNMEIESLTDLLDQIYHNTTIIMNKLKSLNANIKRYIQGLLNKNTVHDLQSIVDNLFIDYKKNIIDNHYHRLKTSDNISKYRPFIISRLNEISINQEMINKACLDLIDKKRFSHQEDAKTYIFKQIDYIISSFENFELIMNEIDKKNAKYIQTSISKILFIVNNTQDLEGKIIKILRDMVNHKKIHPSLFRLFPQKYLEKNSLYTMPTRQTEVTLQTIECEVNLTSEEKQLRFEKYLESSVFSPKSINAYVMKFLKNREKITASSLPLDSLEDYTKLILIYLYSTNHVDYEIKRLNKVFNQYGFLFYDFEIRGKNHD